MIRIFERRNYMDQYTNKIDEMFARIGATYEKGIEIIALKNADYSNSDANGFQNFEESAIIAGGTPEQGFLFRIADKLIRVKNLLKEGKASVKDETIEDTLLDAINYLALLKTYLEMKNKPVQMELPYNPYEPGTVPLEIAGQSLPEKPEEKPDPTFIQKVFQALKK